MFSSSQRLAKRTPNNGIDRESYIQLLADEFRDTTNLGISSHAARVNTHTANISHALQKRKSR